MNNTELLAELKAQAEKINAVMDEDLSVVESPLLAEVIRHAIFLGGKRVRPLLTMAAASLVGEPPQDTPKLAIAYEYLHAASLLHDDVIDNSELRRGQKTANKIWGISQVILAGDYLHARAMTLAGMVGGSPCMDLIGQATSAMVESEFLQIQNAEETCLDEENYFAVLMGKTAALISAACESGIQHNGGTAEQCRALAQYGTNLGLAFQIVDDLLDYLGDPEKTGKAVGNDFQEGKMTLPLISALAASPQEEKQKMLALLQESPEKRSQELDFAHDFIEKNNGFVKARKKAESLMNEACQGLAIFQDGPPKSTLLGLAHYVLTRDK